MKRKIKYGFIDPKSQEVSLIEFATFEQALAAVNLKPTEIDFGSLGKSPITNQRLSIVVYEFGLFKPQAETAYFAVNKKLFAGAALVHAIDEAGNTVSIKGDKFPVKVTFFADGHAAERAIELEEIVQPSIAVGNDVLWVWPQPAPAGMMRGKNDGNGNNEKAGK